MFRSQHVLFTILISISLGCIFCSLFIGSSNISIYQLVMAKIPPWQIDIILQLRLPRTLSAFIVGGLLALAGALLQVLLKNPLADPYILGTSSGAAVATFIAMLMGLSGIWLTTASWIGSFASMILLLGTMRNNRIWQVDKLLLAGIALSCAFTACLSLLLVLSNPQNLPSMFFWLLGDLSGARFPWLQGSVLISVLCICMVFSSELNILTRGPLEAKALGVNVAAIQRKLLILSALLTASAVTLAGAIGFIGLIIPHVFRMLKGYNHRYLLPGVVLLGGSFLTLADTIARTVIAPQQLPVGVVMALVGVPIFIYLLHKQTV